MSDDMSLDDAVKVLNEKNHFYTSTWEIRGDVGSDDEPMVSSIQSLLTAFETRAIAREYLRLDGKPAVRPATRALIEELQRQRTLLDGGQWFFAKVDFDDIDAALAELEDDS